MKARAKKRITSKKKQSSKSQNTKKKPVRVKSRKPVIDRKKVVKQPGSRKTSKGTKGNNLPFKKNNKHGFPKGVSGNPKGRPKLGDSKLDKLRTAIAYYAMGIKLNPKDPITQFIKRAFKNDIVLIALMKKLFPDLKSIEQIELPADMYSPEEMRVMREKFYKRFE